MIIISCKQQRAAAAAASSSKQQQAAASSAAASAAAAASSSSKQQQQQAAAAASSSKQQQQQHPRAGTGSVVFIHKLFSRLELKYPQFFELFCNLKLKLYFRCLFQNSTGRLLSSVSCRWRRPGVL
jgi:hypothetical protein